jgi:hypothetical protein
MGLRRVYRADLQRLVMVSFQYVTGREAEGYRCNYS